jgi:F-type H+-transporting ATPase subunit epsilon
MAQIHLQLVTPQRQVLDEEIDSLTCPTKMGEITILPHHVPLVATLATGELVARSKGGLEHNIHVAGGFVEVKDGNKVVVLADAAEHHHEIDEAEAEAAKLRAEETLKQSNISQEEYALAAASLERSLSKLNLVRKYRHRRQEPAPRVNENLNNDE